MLFFHKICNLQVWIDVDWEAIQEATGVRVASVTGPAREGDVRDSLASLDKIQGQMGYYVTVSLTEGLRRTVESLARS